MPHEASETTRWPVHAPATSSGRLPLPLMPFPTANTFIRHAHALCAQTLRRARQLVFVVGSVMLAACAYAVDGKVEVQRVDSAVQVQASAVLEADTETVWNTLIGYEQLPDFIPDMTSSKTLQRAGRQAVVEQNGRAGLGPFKMDFSLTLAVREEPMQAVFANAVSGDFSRFESSYRLHPQEDGRTRLEYSSLIEPKNGIPPLVGVPVMRYAIQRQFNALLVEIERLAAVRTGRPTAAR